VNRRSDLVRQNLPRLGVVLGEVHGDTKRCTEPNRNLLQRLRYGAHLKTSS
jgi:hypothetical protein